MKVVFRTDASDQIGTGHVIRCLTLASALRDRGVDCVFISREHPGNLLELVRGQGFEAISLAAQTDADRLGASWEKDAEETMAAIGDARVDWLIVDHYSLDARWETALKPRCHRIFVIDDLADRPHDCDLLLDQNLVAGLADRYDGMIPDRCGKLLGPKFALLQAQYAGLHRDTPRREGPVRRVLVYFGGADSENVTGRTISAFLSLERHDVSLDVVINPDGPHSAAIRSQVENEKGITLHAGLPSLAMLMAEADLAVGAGGTTSWERCCLGVPALVVTLAENQTPIAAELGAQQLIRWLGDQADVDEARLAQALEEIFDDGLDPSWSERCRQLVDGKGAERVCRVVMLGADTPLVARHATQEDESLILEWANDPLVRRNAFVAGAIDPDTHRAWFRKRLGDPRQCRLYVVESDRGLPVGQVRFERSGDSWEIHYGLDACFRGRGIGTKLLECALEAFRSDGGIQRDSIFGRVKPDNKPSCHVFKKLGFSEEFEVDELVYRQEAGNK